MLKCLIESQCIFGKQINESLNPETHFLPKSTSYSACVPLYQVAFVPLQNDPMIPQGSTRPLPREPMAP